MERNVLHQMAINIICKFIKQKYLVKFMGGLTVGRRRRAHIYQRNGFSIEIISPDPKNFN